MRNVICLTFAKSVVLTVVVFSLVVVGFAQVRTSPSYQLQSDSVNIGGGFSSSTNYRQESTVGELATGISNSSNYSLRAGYQQMQEVYISLSDSADVTMLPSLPGLTGGVANGSTTFTVITDSPSGYLLTIAAENNPAMQRDGGGGSLADYDDGGAPDYTFTTTATDAHFGFSPQGIDVVDLFLDDGVSTCGSDTQNTMQACWDGLSISAEPIAQAFFSNHPLGATTTVFFRVGIGGATGGVPDGVYTATTTVTALPL